MERTDTDPDDVIGQTAPARRDVMEALDTLLVDALPGRSRTVWEGTFWGGTEQQIIGYGDIVQPRPRGDDVEWFLIGLAAQQRHVSVYVNAAEDGQYLGALYAERLGKVKVGAANISITSLDRVDLDVLRELAEHAHRITPPDTTRA